MIVLPRRDLSLPPIVYNHTEFIVKDKIHERFRKYIAESIYEESKKKDKDNN